MFIFETKTLLGCGVPVTLSQGQNVANLFSSHPDTKLSLELFPKVIQCPGDCKEDILRVGIGFKSPGHCVLMFVFSVRVTGKRGFFDRGFAPSHRDTVS